MKQKRIRVPSEKSEPPPYRPLIFSGIVHHIVAFYFLLLTNSSGANE